MGSQPRLLLVKSHRWQPREEPTYLSPQHVASAQGQVQSGPWPEKTPPGTHTISQEQKWVFLPSIPSNAAGGHCNVTATSLPERQGGPSPLLLVTSGRRMMEGQCSLGRGRKSPTNIGAVACSRASGLGMQEEIQAPGGGQELGGERHL